MSIITHDILYTNLMIKSDTYLFIAEYVHKVFIEKYLRTHVEELIFL